MNKINLSNNEIIHLAKLAGLKLTEKEIEDIRNKLSETLEYVDNLNQLNTNAVIPTSQTTGLVNVFFKDGQENKRGLTKDSLFIVPTIKHHNI